MPCGSAAKATCSSRAARAPTFEDPQALAALLPICALAGPVLPEKLADALGEKTEQWLQQSREELAHNVVALHAHWDDARRLQRRDSSSALSRSGVQHRRLAAKRSARVAAAKSSRSAALSDPRELAVIASPHISGAPSCVLAATIDAAHENDV